MQPGRVVRQPARHFVRADDGRRIEGEMRGAQLAMPLNVQHEGELQVYTFVLPFLPPSKNVYDQWPGQWKHAAKKKWLRVIADECEASMVPKDMPRVGLAARLVFATKTRRDPQNYAQALWHWVPDALVRCGVLLDDRDGCVKIGPNWGLTMVCQPTRGPKKNVEKTILALSMRVKGGA